MQSQGSANGGGGGSVGVLTLTLLEKLLSLDASNVASRFVVREAFDDLAGHMLGVFESKPRNIVTKVDLGNVKQMLLVVNSIITSKNIGLTTLDKRNLAYKVVEVFLKIVKDVHNDNKTRCDL